jgi:hypothetical protein
MELGRGGHRRRLCTVGHHSLHPCAAAEHCGGRLIRLWQSTRAPGCPSERIHDVPAADIVAWPSEPGLSGIAVSNAESIVLQAF